MLDRPLPWILAAVGLALVCVLWLARRDLIHAARTGSGRKRRLVQAGLAMLAWLGFTVGAGACSPRASCYSPVEPPRQGPSDDYHQFDRLHREAEALLSQTKRGLATPTAQKSIARIEERLVMLEPFVSKLPKAERPHARRLVDQTLSLLDGIRSLLEEREQAAP